MARSIQRAAPEGRVRLGRSALLGDAAVEGRGSRESVVGGVRTSELAGEVLESVGALGVGQRLALERAEGRLREVLDGGLVVSVIRPV